MNTDKDFTGGIVYNSRSYLVLCYARMRGKRWFTKEDYRKFHLYKPEKISKLYTSLDRLVEKKFVEMSIEKDTEYFRITDAGVQALAAIGAKRAERERLAYIENGRLGMQKRSR